jgi:hypothetical protein
MQVRVKMVYGQVKLTKRTMTQTYKKATTSSPIIYIDQWWATS